MEAINHRDRLIKKVAAWETTNKMKMDKHPAFHELMSKMMGEIENEDFEKYYEQHKNDIIQLDVEIDKEKYGSVFIAGQGSKSFTEVAFCEKCHNELFDELKGLGKVKETPKHIPGVTAILGTNPYYEEEKEVEKLNKEVAEGLDKLIENGGR